MSGGKNRVLKQEAKRRDETPEISGGTNHSRSTGPSGMAPAAVYAVGLALVWTALVAAQIPLDWRDAVAEGNLLFGASEPADRDFMPAIANGFLGTVVGSGRLRARPTAI